MVVSTGHNAPMRNRARRRIPGSVRLAIVVLVLFAGGIVYLVAGRSNLSPVRSRIVTIAEGQVGYQHPTLRHLLQ